jgi:hypothetical protein
VYREFAVKPRGAPLAVPAHAIFLEMWAESRRVAFNLLNFNCETSGNIKYVATSRKVAGSRPDEVDFF